MSVLSDTAVAAAVGSGFDDKWQNKNCSRVSPLQGEKVVGFFSSLDKQRYFFYGVFGIPTTRVL